ncbi:MAG: serine hydrolase domain-containing protein [Ilumatobacteraceae bacterium]
MAEPTAAPDPAIDELVLGLERSLDDFVGDVGRTAPAVIVQVTSPPLGLRWRGVRGTRSLDGDHALATDCFRIASVAKTFTAVSVLRLVEAGQLSIEDPVEAHLPDDLRSLFAGAIDESTRAGITVDRLLRHTSGVYDFGRDAEYARTVGREPQHEWTAAELVELALRRGPLVGAPGERFHYSDTGFTLLAGVVEQLTGTALPLAYRHLVEFERLGLAHTWLEGREPAPDDGPVRLHQHLDGRDMYDLHPSCDTFGGGGLVSTTDDLTRFVRALVAGDLLSASLMDAMLRTDRETDLGELGAFAGQGIFRTPVAVLGRDGAPTGRHVDRLGHEGFWGVWMHHYPELDLTVAGTHTGVPIDDAARKRLLEAPVHLVATV